jgi:hypothetical protein
LLSIIQAAGWPIWPLLLCSIAAVTLILERLSSLRASRIVPPRLLDEVMSVTRSSLPGPEVVNKLAENSVLGTVLAMGLRAVIAEPRINREALRAGLRIGRPRRGAPDGALPEHPRHDRLGGTVARADGNRDRHDRDLRIAGTDGRATIRRFSPTESRSRSTTPPSA